MRVKDYIPRCKILKNLLIQSLPWIIGAAFYAGIMTWNRQAGKPAVSAFIGSFAASFFFLSWLAGQYLRVAKQSDDSFAQDQISAGIDEIRTSINQLNARPLAGETVHGSGVASPIEAPDQPARASLIEESANAVRDGYVLAGLLEAGVALEHAIRTRAERHGILVSRGASIRNLINAFRGQYSEDFLGSLHELWNLRNQIVHLSPGAVGEIVRNPELLSHFSSAIEKLNEANEQEAPR